MRSIITLLLLATPLWAQVPGSPEGKEKARGFFRTATQHYDLGEFPEALNDFKEAYRFYEEPIFLFNIGQCHRQMGQKEQAIRFFRVYLSKSPKAPNRADVTDMIGKLEVALAQERRAQTGKPEGTLAPPETRNELKTEIVELKPKPADETKPAEIKPQAKPAEIKAQAKPAEIKSSPSNTLVVQKQETPVYKKWWLWTAVAVVVVAGVGIGLGVGLSSSNQTPSANTDFGTYKPF